MRTTSLARAARASIAAISVAVLLSGASTNASPLIGCPSGPIDVSAYKMAKVTIDLPIQGADSVYMPAGYWSNGKFTFVASRQGLWKLTVFAFSGTDRASCVIQLNVRFDDSAAPQTANDQSGTEEPATSVPVTTDPQSNAITLASPSPEHPN